MFFRKKEKIEKHAKKFDKLVTWIIIGWAVASIFGLSKTKKGRKITKKVSYSWVEVAKKSYSLFWKSLVKILSTFDKKGK